MLLATIPSYKKEGKEESDDDAVEISGSGLGAFFGR
jgi:hypothetical protein